MTTSLVWLRYPLILVPAVATPYLVPIPSYPMYVLQLLVLLLVARVRELVKPARLFVVLTLAETAGAAWLSYHYQGILYVMFLSVLVLQFERERSPARIPLAVLMLAAMNVSLQNSDAGKLLTANLEFATAASLLFRSSGLKIGREELQRLYDELRKKHYELDEARKRIIEYARKVEDSAQAEERNRIARDIHDDLGHKLIRLKMMLEAVLHIMPTQTDKGMELIRQVRDQLTDSMETMRKTVRRLKPDEADLGSYSLDRLIEDLSREPGFKISYQVRGMPYPIYPSCEIVLYRNAQEAITNAIRHGNANEVDIELQYNENELIMTVSNNGQVPQRLDRHGLGLSGMEERTRLLGGQLVVEWDTRFAVTTRIPVKAI